MRQAVIMARLRALRSFAAVAVLAFEQHRLGRRESQIQAEFLASQLGAENVIGSALQTPIVEHDISVAFGRLSKTETGARCTLIMEEVPYGRVRQRGMREQNLFCGKHAGIVFIDRRTRAEERHLEAERLVLAGIEPTRDVPPLHAKRGMRAMVGG